MRTSLSRLCVSNIFGVRAGFDLDTRHIFPQGVLATVTLIGGVVAVRGSKGCTSFLVSGCHSLVRDAVFSSVTGNKALKVELNQALFSLNVHLPQRRGVLK